MAETDSPQTPEQRMETSAVGDESPGAGKLARPTSIEIKAQTEPKDKKVRM